MKKLHADVQKVISAYRGQDESFCTDVLGSFTGTTEKGYPPVQDVDDL